MHQATLSNDMIISQVEIVVSLEVCYFIGISEMIGADIPCTEE